MKEELSQQTIFKCPKCGEYFKNENINGIYVRCDCGYIEDSTFDMIMVTSHKE